MKIRILKSAQEDLREGYWFYESQEAGLGDYFLDSLNSDIESLNKNLITHVIPAVSCAGIPLLLPRDSHQRHAGMTGKAVFLSDAN